MAQFNKNGGRVEMKGFLSVLLVLIICLCILNYNNENASFDFEEYITNISDNVEFMPKPPSGSDFMSYQEIQDTMETKNILKIFLEFVGVNLKTLWAFIMYPFKWLFWLVKNIVVFFKDLIIWG